MWSGHSPFPDDPTFIWNRPLPPHSARPLRSLSPPRWRLASFTPAALVVSEGIKRENRGKCWIYSTTGTAKRTRVLNFLTTKVRERDRTRQRERTRAREWDHSVGGGSCRVVTVIFASDLSFPLGVRLLGIQRHGCFCAKPGRSGAQGEKEDPICRSVFCAHQLGPSASGDGEQVVDRTEKFRGKYKFRSVGMMIWMQIGGALVRGTRFTGEIEFIDLPHLIQLLFQWPFYSCCFYFQPGLLDTDIILQKPAPFPSKSLIFCSHYSY